MDWKIVTIGVTIGITIGVTIAVAQFTGPPEIAQQEGFLSQNFSTQHRPVTASAVQSDELKVIGMFRRPSGWADDVLLNNDKKIPGFGRKSDHFISCSHI